jgi:hypothetical protein
MNFSEEFISKMNQFGDMVQSDKEIMDKIENKDFRELNEEESAALESWFTSGDPAVYDFMMKFIQSDFFRKSLKS